MNIQPNEQQINLLITLEPEYIGMRKDGKIQTLLESKKLFPIVKSLISTANEYDC